MSVGLLLYDKFKVAGLVLFLVTFIVALSGACSVPIDLVLIVIVIFLLTLSTRLEQKYKKGLGSNGNGQ